MSILKQKEQNVPSEWVSEVTKLLPYLALFVRVSIGLSLFNTGLIGVLRKGFTASGNPINSMMGQGGGSVFAPGMEGLVMSLPYAELALGVGLILGIFTTLTALLTCGLSLLIPLMSSFMLMTSAGLGPAINNPMNTAFDSNRNLIVYLVLVILSPTSINRHSIDALIFHRSPRPLADRAEEVRPVAKSDELL